MVGTPARSTSRTGRRPRDGAPSPSPDRRRGRTRTRDNEPSPPPSREPSYDPTEPDRRDRDKSYVQKNDMGFKVNTTITLPKLPPAHEQMEDWLFDVGLVLTAFTISNGEYLIHWINNLDKKWGTDKQDEHGNYIRWDPLEEPGIRAGNEIWMECYRKCLSSMDKVAFSALIVMIKYHILHENNGGYTIRLTDWYSHIKDDLKISKLRMGDGHTLWCRMLYHIDWSTKDAQETAIDAYYNKKVAYTSGNICAYMDNMKRLAKQAGVTDQANLNIIVKQMEQDPRHSRDLELWKFRYHDKKERTFKNLYAVYTEKLKDKHDFFRVPGMKGRNHQDRRWPGRSYGHAAAAEEADPDSEWLVPARQDWSEGYGGASEAVAEYPPEEEDEWNWGYGAGAPAEEGSRREVEELLGLTQPWDKEDTVWDYVSGQNVSYTDWVNNTKLEELNHALAVKGRRKGKGKRKGGKRGGKGGSKGQGQGKGGGKYGQYGQYGQYGKGGAAVQGDASVTPQMQTELLEFYSFESPCWLDHVLYDPHYDSYVHDPSNQTAECIVAAAKGNGRPKGKGKGKGKGQDRSSTDFQQYVKERGKTSDADRTRLGPCHHWFGMHGHTAGQCPFGQNCRFSHTKGAGPPSGGKGKGPGKAASSVSIDGQEYILSPVLQSGTGAASTWDGGASVGQGNWTQGPWTQGPQGNPQGMYALGNGGPAAGSSSLQGVQRDNDGGYTLHMSQSQVPQYFAASKHFEQQQKFQDAVRRQQQTRPVNPGNE